MTTVDAARGRLDFGAVVQRIFGVLRRNIRVLAILGFGLYMGPSVAVLAIRAAMGIPLIPTDPTASFQGIPLVLTLASFVVTLITWALMQVAMVRVAIADLNGRKLSTAESLRDAVQRMTPMIGLSVVMGIGVFGGFVLLFVPGLILMTIWLVAGPALIVEKRGLMASLTRSRELTRGHRWTVFGLMIVFVIIYYILALAIGALMMSSLASMDLSNLAAGALNTPALIAAVPSMILSVIVVVVAGVGSAVIYYDLRASKEGVAPEQLASVFD